MKIKPNINYWLFIIMAVITLTLLVSSLFLWVILPNGFFASRLLWVDIHRWFGLALTVAVTLHLVLHLKWLTHMTRQLVLRRK